MSTKAGALGSVVAAALVPKCPFCVAAMLSAVGVGVGVAQSVAPYVRVGGFVLAGLLTALALGRTWSRRRGHCARRS